MSIDNADVSTPVIVQRWKRYGHDRAYVKRAGEDLGYRDLKTGDVTCSRPDVETLVTTATAEMFEHAQTVAAAQRYIAKHGAPEPERPVAAAAALPTPAGEPCTLSATPSVEAPATRAPIRGPEPELLPDEDLAFNVPGQAVRQVATELRHAAPVKTFFARVVGAKTDERSYRIGADGEREVAHRLAKLGPEWRVLHAVPIGNRDSDIDHVIIGPAGVFTINTKNHPQANVWVRDNTVKVNGYNQPCVRNNRHEATRAARLLTAAAGFDVEVHGIVAIMGAHRGFTVKEQPRDGLVRVVTRKDVASHLRGLETVLGEPSIARIYAVARHLATWHPGSVRWEDFD